MLIDVSLKLYKFQTITFNLIIEISYTGVIRIYYKTINVNDTYVYTSSDPTAVDDSRIYIGYIGSDSVGTSDDVSLKYYNGTFKIDYSLPQNIINTQFSHFPKDIQYLSGKILIWNFSAVVVEAVATKTYTFALQTSSIKQSWTCVRMSDSGQYIIASGGSVYVSNDYGISWNIRYPLGGTTIQYCPGVAISSTGQYMVAAMYNFNYICVSQNYGVTWTQSTTTQLDLWQTVSISPNGLYITGASYSNIYKSNNYGANWSIIPNSGSNIPNPNWNNICISSDGSKIAAVSYNNNNPYPIWTYNTSGSVWLSSVPISGTCTAFDMAADGLKMVACIWGDKIYTSNNFGVSWTARNVAIQYWGAVKLLSDGLTIVALCNALNYDPYIYISNDFGINWTFSLTMQSAGTLNSIAISSDGNRLATTSLNANYVGIATSPLLFSFTSVANTFTTLQSYNNNNYYVVQFYGNNTIIVKQNVFVNFIIVGGGGGGGSSSTNIGGGGGAGGQVYQSSASLLANTSYNVVIGSGGSIGIIGSKSTFNSIDASGGNPGSSYVGGSAVLNNRGFNGFYQSNGDIPPESVTANGVVLPLPIYISDVSYSRIANGGAGVPRNSSGVIVVANTGNGGGGNSSGGSGLVILSILTTPSPFNIIGTFYGKVDYTGGYFYITFTGSSSIVFLSSLNANINDFNIIIVGGGGGGGGSSNQQAGNPRRSTGGGGGGAATARLNTNVSTNTTYNIVVGAGGGGGPGNLSGTSGTESSFKNGSTNIITCGGGSKGKGHFEGVVGGLSGTVTVPVGITYESGGGGNGGSGFEDSTPTPIIATDGTNGSQFILPSTVAYYFSGGGGGGGGNATSPYTGTGGSAGNGGGGVKGIFGSIDSISVNGVSATNYGGGGGGGGMNTSGNSSNGGSGGSGLIILYFKYP